MAYRVERSLDNGIERISYIPTEPKYKTPIVFQHGAWHGAWCWQYWQELFAEWGWVSHAHSLPAHGKSEAKRPIRLCTMGYYRDALQAEIERCETKPVLVGHSMGGMISQWYLAHVGDLPATVLLASMPLYDNPLRYLISDPIGMSLAVLTWNGYFLVRSPQQAKRLFLSEGALISAEALQAQLDSESLFVPLQLTPLTWHPRKNPKTPILVMAAEFDTIFTVKEQENLASFYGADYYLMQKTAHNAMIEATYQSSARYLQDWLLAKGID